MFSVILIPALLFASVAPTYAWSAPAEAAADVLATDELPFGGPPIRTADELPGPSDPRLPADSDDPDGRLPVPPVSKADDESDEGGEPSTTASPPVGLTPRVESLELLERCLRATTLSKTAPWPVPVGDSWRVHVHHKPARQDLLARRSHCFSGMLRTVAPCVQSNAPPQA